MHDLTVLGLLLATIFPLLCTLVPNQPWAKWLLAAAPLPALVASTLLPADNVVDLPWLLLGVRWGIDSLSQAFLFITALLWSIAGLYSAHYPANQANAWRFRIFFCLTLIGNLLVVIAADMGSFFLGFTLMGLAAYGLVAHQASITTRRAGRIYLIWTILGEVLLFAGIVFAAHTAGSLYFSDLLDKQLPLVTGALLLVGFGIKVALPSLHAWLPVAHGAAPPAISALLSGVMVKAGILGLLKFLNAGTATSLIIAEWLVIGGLAGAFYGVAFGLLQTAPKVILAYSTMSQLGILSMVTGLVLQNPNSTSLRMALLLYIAHHAWVKGALFLGVGVFKQTLSWRALLLLTGLAAILAGVPWTSGALAKGSVKLALPLANNELAQWLLLSTLATTVLMGRLVWSLWQYRLAHLKKTTHHHTILHWSQYLAWFALSAWVLIWPYFFNFSAVKVIDLVPLVAGFIIITLTIFPRMPIGDLPVLLAQNTRRLVDKVIKFYKLKSKA